MNILVANFGSTSFKYQLFEGSANALRPVAKGACERVTDYGGCIRDTLRSLEESGHIKDAGSINAVGFKTVLGFDVTGCLAADETVVNDLRRSAPLAPVHNPVYAEGIEQFREILPGAELVALYETAFYQWAPAAGRCYAVPKSWREIGIRRNGFHGASHKFTAERSAELLGRGDVARRVRELYHGEPAPVEEPPLRVVSCHLGGSSSITGIRNGLAIDTSMGLSPQSGLPQNNRVGDLDSMAVTYAMRTLGIGVEEAERQLTRESGLLGISGVSNDTRDIRKAAESGNARARLALDHLVHCIRHYIGAYAFQMGGLDALVFTGGIGENDATLRDEVCRDWAGLGVLMDPEQNKNTRAIEGAIHSINSRVSIFVIPANEERVIAAETCRFLTRQST